jgi:uncharacterized membrane protein
MAALYGLTFVIPPAPIDKAALFIPQCVQSCEAERDTAFCQRFCNCIREELERQTVFEEVLDGKRNVTSDPLVLATASACTSASEE